MIPRIRVFLLGVQFPNNLHGWPLLKSASMDFVSTKSRSTYQFPIKTARQSIRIIAAVVVLRIRR